MDGKADRASSRCQIIGQVVDGSCGSNVLFELPVDFGCTEYALSALANSFLGSVNVRD